MNRKSITQEYYTLAVDANGNMPPMHKDESNAGTVVAGFMDLLLNGVIAEEKKKITVINELPDELKHLTTLYEYLNEKPRTKEKMMNDFYYGKNTKELIAQIGESLLADRVAVTGSGGIFGPKVTYIPEKTYKDEVIDYLKAAVTKDDGITPHDVALIYILKETKNLNQYFSKHESDELKAKLKELKKDPQNKELAEMINYVSDMITVIIACIFIHSV